VPEARQSDVTGVGLYKKNDLRNLLAGKKQLFTRNTSSDTEVQELILCFRKPF
jgi:hypothetical protein